MEDKKVSKSIFNYVPNTAILVQYENSEYIKGQSSKPKWENVTFLLGTLESDTFYVQWTNAYGSDLVVAQSNNINQLATIRMGYHPKLHEVLNSKKVRIFVNGETDAKKAFTTYGPCDNVHMKNQMLEFKVQRLDVK